MPAQTYRDEHSLEWVSWFSFVVVGARLFRGSFGHSMRSWLADTDSRLPMLAVGLGWNVDVVIRFVHAPPTVGPLVVVPQATGWFHRKTVVTVFWAVLKVVLPFNECDFMSWRKLRDPPRWIVVVKGYTLMCWGRRYFLNCRCTRFPPCDWETSTSRANSLNVFEDVINCNDCWNFILVAAVELSVADCLLPVVVRYHYKAPYWFEVCRMASSCKVRIHQPP